jgi:hypothetical protein
MIEMQSRTSTGQTPPGAVQKAQAWCAFKALQYPSAISIATFETEETRGLDEEVFRFLSEVWMKIITRRSSFAEMSEMPCVIDKTRTRLNYENLTAALRDYASELEIDIDSILNAASVHMLQGQPRPRQEPLSQEELGKLIADDDQALNE